MFLVYRAEDNKVISVLDNIPSELPEGEKVIEINGFKKEILEEKDVFIHQSGGFVAIRRPQPTEAELLQAELETLKQENLLLQAQNQANADRADFHEDLIAEMAMIVYP